MLVNILKLISAIIIAIIIGKLLSKLKLPSILGWLIAGMIVGPHALQLINQSLLEATWYEVMINILECSVGLLIGSELVFSKLKKSGKEIFVLTLTESLGTFVIVTLIFSIVLIIMGYPIYLAFIFGAIALATAPAPSLSIVREFKTKGPVTNALIPMAALDDIVAVVVFFITISVISNSLSATAMPAYIIPLIVLLPIVIGVFTGFICGFALKKTKGKGSALLIICTMILVSSAIGLYINHFVLPEPALNFMLIGMAFATTFSNMVSEERLQEAMNVFNPILGLSMIIVILNLGMPLDYHLIIGAGFFTFIYIAARALGKYLGTYFGAVAMKSKPTVKKYLGLTLLPHSGVSLVFTGIAVNTLSGPAPEYVKIIQGTIAAAAVINEVIAVIIAKKAFDWAGEIEKTPNSK